MAITNYRIGELLQFTVILFCCLFGCTRLSNGELNKEKPNIIFLFADDMTYSAIRAHGNTEIKTPNLDRLAAQGISFTHAYNMGAWNGAVCLASRAMIMSGRSLWRANDFRQNWVTRDTTATRQSWGKLMEQAGYDTYMTGKWHIDAPAEDLFQKVRNVRPGMPPHFWKHHEIMQQLDEVVGKQMKDGKLVTVADIMPVGYYRPLNEGDTTWSPSDPKFGGFWKGGTHWSEVVKDDALAFIEHAKTSENPFFMYLAFNAPHDHRQSPQEYLDMYPLDQVSLPENWLPEYPWKDAIGNTVRLRDEALAPYPRTEFAIKTHLQEYYAIISHMDAQIGRILSGLETAGLMDNTYVFFTADHGLAVGQHGLMGKQSMFDHSIRVPLLMMGPDIPQGEMLMTDVYLQDVMPTVLELAGIQSPDYVEFKSLLALAKKERAKSYYPEIYGAYTTLQRMIRKNGYKLIVYPRIRKVLLFNLESDPLEKNDLSDSPESSSVAKVLFEDLMTLQQQMGDTLDLRPIYERLAGK